MRTLQVKVATLPLKTIQELLVINIWVNDALFHKEKKLAWKEGI